MKDRKLEVRNPYNGEIVGEVNRGDTGDIDRAVTAATAGAARWQSLPRYFHAEVLHKTAERLIGDAESLAATIVSEAGKTIREARAEVIRAAGIFRYAGEEARRPHGETLPFDAFAGGEGREGYWVREPIGVVGAITPWNVPLALTAHKLATAFASGNAVVHKPAEQTPFNALRLAEILSECGLPPGVLQVVTGLGEEAGAALVRHPDVRFVSFTGSRAVGVRLPGQAGYKRVALELGGNSAVVLAPTADVNAAAEGIVRGAFSVAGQICISVQRIIVHRSLESELIAALIPLIAALRLGDPADEATDVGVLINSAACERIARTVDEAAASGAKVLAGGKRIGATGYTPTLISGVPATSSLAHEEVFGPVVILQPYDDFTTALRLANDTPYGLNAGVFTRDIGEAFAAIKHLQVGSVLINDVPTYRSDLMPYGGRKGSGLGREGVRFAMEEMTELKTVCFKL